MIRKAARVFIRPSIKVFESFLAVAVRYDRVYPLPAILISHAIQYLLAT